MQEEPCKLATELLEAIAEAGEQIQQLTARVVLLEAISARLLAERRDPR